LSDPAFVADPRVTAPVGDFGRSALYAMNKFTGLFELRLPTDLIRKLRHDLERMETSPLDQYAAFDFFVTAEHIVDWLHPTDEPSRRALRDSSHLLRITSHLANGSKHFEATAKPLSAHRAVFLE
jgi:hypothetical protein